MDQGTPIVAFRQVAKTYPNGTQALTNASFNIRQGAVHAICGENGAGKSTLMKILFGLESHTGGEILLDGAVANTSVADFAGKNGIGMVHQHFSLVPGLTVVENIILGHEPKSGVMINAAKAREHVVALSKRFELEVIPTPRSKRFRWPPSKRLRSLKPSHATRGF